MMCQLAIQLQQQYVSQISICILFGMTVKVDKGFLIKNKCALERIISIRRIKMLDRHMQQPSPDKDLT